MPKYDVTELLRAQKDRIEREAAEAITVDTEVEVDQIIEELRSQPRVTTQSHFDVEDLPTEDVISPGRSLIPYGPLRQIRPEFVKTRAEAMEQLNQTLILNRYGLPGYIYRSDMLDCTLLSRLGEDVTSNEVHDMEDMLAASSVELGYEEGYPVVKLGHGLPFWDQLPWETQDAYLAFQKYLNIIGIRQLHTLNSWKPEQLEEWYNSYMWAFRVKAYDMYLVAHHEKLKIDRRMTVEGRQYELSSKLIEQFSALFDTEDMTVQMAAMSPFQAISAIEKLAKIQRESVGLGTSDKNGGENLKRIVPVAVMMEQIAAGSQVESDTKQISVETLEDDPRAMELAQELIIRSQPNAE